MNNKTGDEKTTYRDWVDALHLWLKDVKQHEMKHFIEQIMQGSEMVKKLTHKSEEQLEQYRKNLLLDLSHYRHHKDSYDSLAMQEFKETIWSELAEIADRSQLEWHALLEDFKHHGEYRKGQWVGFGEIVCEQCGHINHIYHPTKISACPECNGIFFKRQPLAS